MAKKDELIHQLECTIGEHEKRSSQLEAEFNEDKKRALDESVINLVTSLSSANINN